MGSLGTMYSFQSVQVADLSFPNKTKPTFDAAAGDMLPLPGCLECRMSDILFPFGV